ncbi:MAG: insulinase family protein, partial [Simkaniaceae bacterium]|nr:insulinase family protein [Simkaniaceae bacterium]
VMHIANDDPENLFCMSFRTYPENSNGVAHILEHTVLCGSEKFPVRDPFFSMHRRSLHTFMNAMTGSDFTCYPAGSQVEKDFYNLFEVYLDAVFHPKLDELSCLQEGHRLEVKEGDGLINKGVVFNEMKGAMASPDARMWQALLENLMPDLTYANNSGGDPKEIANITREDLLNFHKKYYDPSQCLFFTYGNLPVKKHLAFIEKHALKNVKKSPDIPPIPPQPRWKESKSITAPFPATDDDAEPFAVLSWLTTRISDVQDLLGLMVLDSVLTDTDASPLKRAILDSKLCASADAFIDPETSETPYVIVCKGCKKGAAKKIEKATLEALEKICKDGIDPEMAKSALHQLELHRMEITGGRNPFGLTLFMRAALPMQHGCDPANALKIFTHFEHIEKAIEDRHYLTNLAKKYLLDNPHRLLIEMIPDSTLSIREEEAEQKVLEEKNKKLKKQEKEKLIADAKALEASQEIEDDLSCLPQIKLADVPKDARNLVLHNIGARGPLSCYYHNTFTNHLTYAHALFDLPAMCEDDLMKAELLVTLLPELGSGNRTYAENLAFLHRHTGGIGTYFSLHTLYGNPEMMHPILAIRGKTLSRNIPHLFSAMNDLITSPRFD